MMAGDKVRARTHQGWVGRTDVCLLPATASKGTACGHSVRRRQVSLEQDAASCALDSGIRHGN
jgi:hypothetical protein